MLRRQPVTTGLGVLCGEDFNAIATAGLESQRHDAPIHLGTTAAMADIGMHQIGEIQHGGTFRQVEHLAPGGQQVDAILDDIGAETGKQGGIVVVLVAAFQQLPHPGDLAFEAGVATAAFLVAPMRGKAELGIRMHVVRTDLHFQRTPLRADHGSMQ